MHNLDNVHGVSRNPCFALALSLMKRATHWKTIVNQEEGFVSIGEPLSKHVSKTRGITSKRISYDMFRKLLTTSVGPLIGPNLTNTAPNPDGIPYGAYRSVGVGACNSLVVLTSICGKEVLFQNIFAESRNFFSPRLPTSVKMEDLFDLQTHFGHWHCAIAIANLSLLLSVEASIGTPWNAFILRIDASRPGTWHNIFEIETTALVHVACVLQESRVLLTYEHWVARFNLPLLAKYLQRQHQARGIRGSSPRTLSYGQRCTTRLSCDWFPLWEGLRSWLQMCPRDINPVTLTTSTSCTLLVPRVFPQDNWSLTASSGAAND